MWDRWSCVDFITDTFSLFLNVQASCSGWWTTAIQTGEYVPAGVVGGHLVYHKETPDGNGKIWTIRYDVATDRWIFDYMGGLLSVGGTIFGSTIQPLDLNAPGEFSYGAVR